MTDKQRAVIAEMAADYKSQAVEEYGANWCKYWNTKADALEAALADSEALAHVEQWLEKRKETRSCQNNADSERCINGPRDQPGPSGWTAGG